MSKDSMFLALVTPLNAALTTGLRALTANTTEDDVNRLFHARNTAWTVAANECWPERSYLTAEIVREVEEAAKAQGRAITNWCTMTWLRERYPDVQHQMGVGWYVPKTVVSTRSRTVLPVPTLTILVPEAKEETCSSN